MEKYLKFKPIGDFKKDIESYFLIHGRLDIYEHTIDVVQELHDMKKYFGNLIIYHKDAQEAYEYFNQFRREQ